MSTRIRNKGLMSSNTVNLVEYFEKKSRGIRLHNIMQADLFLTKMQSPRENYALLSSRGNRIVISFFKTREKWHTKSWDRWVVSASTVFLVLFSDCSTQVSDAESTSMCCELLNLELLFLTHKQSVRLLLAHPVFQGQQIKKKIP